MDTNQAQFEFNKSFPSHDKKSGIIREIKKEVEEAEQTTSLETKKSMFFVSRDKHEKKLNILTEYLNFLNSKGFGINKEETVDEYIKQINKLKKLEEETWSKFNKIKTQSQKEQRDKEYQLKSSHCSYCKNKPSTSHFIYSEKNKILKPRKRNVDPYKKEYLFCSEGHFEKWHKKNHYCCAECSEEKYDGNYKYNKKQKDQQKFCSDNCYYTHYAETCDNCLEKCVSKYKDKATGLAQTYYSDGVNKTGTLCSKCHQEQLKEEREEKKKDKEWEETCKKLDKNMDDLVDAMVEVAKGKEDEEIDNSSDNDNSDKSNNSTNNIERERERGQPHSTIHTPHSNFHLRI